jgi:hypothetical protein
LKKEGVEITLAENDTPMGVLVQSNFTVCEVHR